MLVFGLSLVGLWLLLLFVVPIALLANAIGIINILQRKRPTWLPEKLRNWDWLPLWMRSLQPLDSVITTCKKKLVAICPSCGFCKRVSKPSILSKEKLTKLLVVPDFDKFKLLMKRKHDKEECFGYGVNEKSATNYDYSNPGFIQPYGQYGAKQSRSSQGVYAISDGVTRGHPAGQRGHPSQMGHPGHRSNMMRGYPSISNNQKNGYSLRGQSAGPPPANRRQQSQHYPSSPPGSLSRYPGSNSYHAQQPSRMQGQSSNLSGYNGSNKRSSESGSDISMSFYEQSAYV